MRLLCQRAVSMQLNSCSKWCYPSSEIRFHEKSPIYERKALLYATSQIIQSQKNKEFQLVHFEFVPHLFLPRDWLQLLSSDWEKRAKASITASKNLLCQLPQVSLFPLPFSKFLSWGENRWGTNVEDEARVRQIEPKVRNRGCKAPTQAEAKISFPVFIVAECFVVCFLHLDKNYLLKALANSW